MILKKGINGIIAAVVPEDDPEQVLDVFGLVDPFTGQFFISIVNGWAAPIYCDALLVSPPAAWTDSAQQLGVWAAGLSQYKVKNNATRDRPAGGVNEALTLRIRAYSDAGYTTQIDQVDVALTIFYEDFSTGTLDDLTTFDDGTQQGWALTQEVGSDAWFRVDSIVFRSVPYGWRLQPGIASGHISYIYKTITVGSGTRAAIIVHTRHHQTVISRQSVFEIETPVSKTSFLLMIPGSLNWMRVGMRLTPGADNLIKLRVKARYKHADNQMIFDDIEVRHW